MIRTIPQFCHLYGGSSPAPSQTRHIPEQVTTRLRAHGLGRPVQSLDDPRLECPELLILHGYRWGASELGACYQNQPHQDYYQTVIFPEEGGVRIISCTAGQIHDLYRSPEGQITQTLS
ncbi:hypothetical protein JST97_21740 [bacterium]|nr:hypothetical protein [bacterium]